MAACVASFGYAACDRAWRGGLSAFSSCTPFLGFHILVAMLIAWVIRGNLIASALGTFIGNPITFPVIWLVVFEVGRYIVGA